MERKLIDYLPIYVQSFAEIRAIMNAEQISVETTWTGAENVMNDQFITLATENGVKRWESILGITPKANFTLDERKFLILARLNEQLPYTKESLESALTSLCGADGYTLKIDSDKYEMVVKLALDNENNVSAVVDLLDKMIPANIVKNVMLFNTNLILADFTHEQLATYTHKELREEIL